MTRSRKYYWKYLGNGEAYDTIPARDISSAEYDEMKHRQIAGHEGAPTVEDVLKTSPLYKWTEVAAEEATEEA